MMTRAHIGNFMMPSRDCPILSWYFRGGARRGAICFLMNHRQGLIMRFKRAIIMVSVAFLAPCSGGQAQTPEIQRLHDALHLMPQQESAWRDYQTATHVSPEEAARRRRAIDMMPTLTAPQRVDLSIAAMQADLESFEKRGAALKIFYGTLSHDQQVTFDSITALQQR
jgi:LTXXQ motif family protein